MKLRKKSAYYLVKTPGRGKQKWVCHMNMLKKYFHKCDQNLVKSVSTLVNVKTCQVCTDSGISTETSEKYFNQSVSPQSSKFLSILKLILNICIFTRQTQRPMANYLLIVFLMFQSKQMLFVIIL